MDYKKEVEKMGWNEEETVNRINSLAEDTPYFNADDINLNAEDLKKYYKDFIETDEEQEVVETFFNKEDKWYKYVKKHPEGCSNNYPILALASY